MPFGEHCEKSDRNCNFKDGVFTGPCLCNCLGCQVQRAEGDVAEREAGRLFWDPIVARHNAVHRGCPLDFKCGCIPAEVELEFKERNLNSEKGGTE